MIRTMTFVYLFIIFGIICLVPACWKSKKKEDFLVINVLSEQLYDDCHIKGSINVPFQELDLFIKNIDQDAHIVFYCSNYMCTASGYAAKKLRSQGFKNAWAYEGGTAEWYQYGLPVEGPCAQEYLMKVMAPVVHQGEEDLVINAKELAQKMGILKDSQKSLK